MNADRQPGPATHAEVLSILTRARDADPRTDTFGVLIQDPWEDGEQQFFWYPSRGELETALLGAHAFVDAEAFREDAEAWREARFDLDAALGDLAELTPDDAETLDDLVNDFFCIVWIGRYDDLAAGEDPIAMNLREELRWGSPDGHDDPSPVRGDEHDRFVELLRAFGVDEDERSG